MRKGTSIRAMGSVARRTRANARRGGAQGLHQPEAGDRTLMAARIDSDRVRHARRSASISSATRRATQPAPPRGPGRRTVPSRCTRPVGPVAAKWTRPTGFSADPPPGPATPVTATETKAREWPLAPVAMARATGSDTAPCVFSSPSSTPASGSWRVAVGDRILGPERRTDPAITFVRAPATRPPVQLSAVASIRPRRLAAATICCARRCTCHRGTWPFHRPPTRSTRGMTDAWIVRCLPGRGVTA